MSQIYINIKNKSKELRLSRNPLSILMYLVISDIDKKAKDNKTEVSDTYCIDVLNSILKKLNDTLALIISTDRKEDIEKTSQEIKLCSSFLPEEISLIELENIVKSFQTKKELFAHLKSNNINYSKMALQSILSNFELK